MSTPSPMMSQWHSCKEQAKNAILLFRLGDFYEAFYEDASILAKELDLTLTKRHDVPMSGVPAHASELYIDRLVDKGYKVAIAEQIEDPSAVKGLLKREIVRMITPGSIISSSLLAEKSHNFILCITELNRCFGMSFLDLTTGEFFVSEMEEGKELRDELCRLRPKEILISEAFHRKHAPLLQEIRSHFFYTLTVKEEWRFDHQSCLDFLLKHFSLRTLDGFGLKGMASAINASGALLTYIREDLNLSISHITSLLLQNNLSYMAISSSTQRHLELIEPLHPHQKTGSLLDLLDHTQTPMGGRLLKQWITHPLLSESEIKERQDAVEELKSHPFSLKEVKDLQRLIMRIETGFATPRDIAALRFSLEHIPSALQALSPLSTSLIARCKKKLHDFSSLTKLIQNALVDTPPLRLHEGGIFREGYNASLDELLSLTRDNLEWIAKYQTSLREETQIKTLKVSFTKAFGYYIEVSRGQAGKMPASFQRRQTLVNAERFVTPELKDYEHKMLTSEARIRSLENELFQLLRNEVARAAAKIRETASAIAELDCLLSLADVANRRGYVRPLVDQSDLFHIEEGRHPVIETALEEGVFIPNDLSLDSKKRLIVITGPNMAGKSTYLRQAALFAIMAQIGSFIPAKRAHLGIVDKVFTRIGASDDLSRGQSTFMVEMSETAHILHHATSRSLVILDEIGRGTSTYDGISIAWAVAEHLLRTDKAPKTLFATHYWELTALEKEIPGAVNFHVAVHESSEGIIFLHKVKPGSTDKSYGIHVARLAGLPQPVIKRAQEILSKLEKKAPSRKELPSHSQLSFL